MIQRLITTAVACALFGFCSVGSASASLIAAARPTPTPTPTPTPSLVQPITLPGAPFALPSAPSTGPTASPIALTLQNAKMVAVQRSPQLELARAALDFAGGQLQITTSGALPGFNASASAGRSKAPLRSGGGTSLITNTPFTSISGAISLNQLIFDGGSTYAKISSARFSRDAAALNALRAVDTVLFNVAQDYYAALQARYQYQVAVESRKLAEVQEHLVEAQFRAGVASRADVLTAQLPVAQARLAEAQAANGEQTQEALLLNAMGLPSDTPVNLATQTNETVPPLPAFQTVLSTAEAQRTDLQAANASLTAASRSVRAARASRFPSIVGNASAGTTTTGVSNGNIATNGGNYASTYSFGATATMPIFNSGLTSGEIATAEANERTARANLTNTELGVSLSVRQAYLGALTAVEAVNSAKVELDQAQTVLDVTNAQYRAGVTTLVLLLNAQVQLTKARSDYVNALFGAYTAQQNLYLAEGIIANR
jgi:outer membrane protein